MPKKSTALVLMLAAILSAALVTPARAGLIINIYQSGSDVISTSIGSVNITDLTHVENASGRAEITTGSTENDSVVNGNTTSTSLQLYTDISGPRSFRTGSINALTHASSGSGDMDGINASLGAIYLPASYISGSALSATDTYSNTTLSALNLAIGTYTYTWGTGTDADSLELIIGSAPVPEPASITMMALAGVGLGIAHLACKKMAK